MATYDSSITRVEAAGLLAPEYANFIVEGAPAYSAILPMATQLPGLNSDTRYIPITDALPTAQFRNPKDTGYRETSTAEWSYTDLIIEDIQVTIVSPRNVIRDARFPVWDRVRARMAEAVAKKMDEAILFASDADGWAYQRPASWPDGIAFQATSLGRAVSAAARTDMYDALLKEDGVYNLVEQHDYMANGNVGGPRMKGRLRGVLANDGRPIFDNNEVEGIPLTVPRTGVFDENIAWMIHGDFSQIFYGISEDIEYQVATEGVINDPSTGAITHNLLQQKLVAIILDMRIGWQLPRPVNWFKMNKSDRPFPFAILTA